MKIIGRTGKKFLLECDLVEIALLLGFSGIYDSRWKDMLSNMNIEASYGEPRTQEKLEGMELNIGALANKMTAMREHEKKAAKSVETLRALADTIEQAWPALMAPIESA